MSSQEKTTTYYDIWKVEDKFGKKHFYESEQQFKRHGFPRTKSEFYNYKAYRFSSDGWKRIMEI